MPAWVPGSGWKTLIDGDKGMENFKFPQGPFALQFGNHGKAPGGPIRFRKVQVREL
jgi:hypothetical protein